MRYFWDITYTAFHRLLGSAIRAFYCDQIYIGAIAIIQNKINCRGLKITFSLIAEIISLIRTTRILSTTEKKRIKQLIILIDESFKKYLKNGPGGHKGIFTPKTHYLRSHLQEEVDYYGAIGNAAEENIELEISRLHKCTQLAINLKGEPRAFYVLDHLRTKEHIIVYTNREYLYISLKGMGENWLISTTWGKFQGGGVIVCYESLEYQLVSLHINPLVTDFLEKKKVTGGSKNVFCVKGFTIKAFCGAEVVIWSGTDWINLNMFCLPVKLPSFPTLKEKKMSRDSINFHKKSQK